MLIKSTHSGKTIGLFGEAGYDLVNGASNNFIQANFGLRYAF